MFWLILLIVTLKLELVMVVVITTQQRMLVHLILCNIILALCKLTEPLMVLVFNIEILKAYGIMFMIGWTVVIILLLMVC